MVDSLCDPGRGSPSALPAPLSAWVDGDGELVRASILLEYAAQRVLAATFLVGRLDPQRVPELMHRRVSANGRFRAL